MSKEREKVTCKTELEFITEVADDCVADLKAKDREYPGQPHKNIHLEKYFPR